MCDDTLGVLKACLLVETEIVLGASCEIRSGFASAHDSSNSPQVLLNCHTLGHSAYRPSKACADISPFRFIGAVERGRIAPQGPPRAKIGVKNCLFLESYTTMRRLRKQLVTSLGRTKA
jgi:hypothetical protein